VPDRSIRVLVAEDYPPFRRFLASTMQGRPELKVICEVADGLEAVEKARDLQPELVLLDIGLPGLNGIEAARQIRGLSPLSKILFMSQESSADIVQAALETGAVGYVVKADAGLELNAALDSVLRGEMYVSKGLVGHNLNRQRGQSTYRHEVGFYSDDQSLLDGFTHFLGGVLKNGSAAIVRATELRREKLLANLRANGLDMSAAIQRGRYVALDSAEAVSAFMVNDLPDPVLFYRVTGDLITRTAKGVDGDYTRVAICGESAPLLLGKGNPEGAVRLEHLWNEIARSYGVQVFCGYPLSSFQGEAGRHTFGRIRAEHSAVLSR